MISLENITLDLTSFKSLTKERLADLLAIIDESQSTTVRHYHEKVLFIQALCRGELPSLGITQIPQLIGPLLYISSGKLCQYGYGYFKNKLLHFQKIVNIWNVYLGNLANCISSLPDLAINNIIELQIDGFIHLKLQRENILSAKIDLTKIDKLYTIKEDSFYYELFLTNSMDDIKKQLIFSGYYSKSQELFKTLEILNIHINK